MASLQPGKGESSHSPGLARNPAPHHTYRDLGNLGSFSYQTLWATVCLKKGTLHGRITMRMNVHSLMCLLPFLPSDNEEGEPCTLVSSVPPVPPLIETQALKQGGHSTPVLLVRKPGLIRLRESVKNKWPGSKLAEPGL